MNCFPGRFRRAVWLALAMVVASAGAVSLADELMIDWYSLSSGAELSAGGEYAVAGGLGLATPEILTGDGYALAGGFSIVPIELSPPEAPQLAIERIGPTVRISWAASATGYLLEWSPLLGPQASWTLLPQLNATNANATTISYTDAAPSGSRYFRLRR